MSTTAKRQLPPDPRTVAEMIPVREAEIKARKAPRCPAKYAHGLMVPRPLAGQSYETMYIGVHYDCKQPTCTVSSCWYSRELSAYHGMPYVVDAEHAEMWDGETWQPVSRAQFDAYWAEREAREQASRAEMADAADRRARERRRKPTVTYDGSTYTVRSRSTEIPDLQAMDRMAALVWLNQNTYAKGASTRTQPNPLAGLGDALTVNVR